MLSRMGSAKETDTETDPIVQSTDSTTTLQPVSFTIIPGESSASFQIDETLKSSQTGWHSGTRKTVVGTTDQVFGSISFPCQTLHWLDLRNCV